MMELLIEPSQMLIDALRDKTASQLIDLIYQSIGCDKLHSIAIHLTAVDLLLQKYPQDYEALMYPNQYTDID